MLTMTTYFTYLDSAIGELLLAGNGEALGLLGFPEGKMRLRHREDWTQDRSLFTAAIDQLQAYFAGELQDFDLPLAPEGTQFQRAVWDALIHIPYGETRSYGDIAQKVGSPKASRAVGAANGQNPIPIIIPCHRVIGKSGALVGFGGGLSTKVQLLDLEQKTLGFRLD
jgi:methylated-DNA-[protein]-cysteine S-methyltransferase